MHKQISIIHRNFYPRIKLIIWYKLPLNQQLSVSDATLVVWVSILKTKVFQLLIACHHNYNKLGKCTPDCSTPCVLFNVHLEILNLPHPTYIFLNQYFVTTAD